MFGDNSAGASSVLKRGILIQKSIFDFHGFSTSKTSSKRSKQVTWNPRLRHVKYIPSLVEQSSTSSLNNNSDTIPTLSPSQNFLHSDFSYKNTFAISLVNPYISSDTRGCNTMFHVSRRSTSKYFLLDYSAIDSTRICTNNQTFRLYTNSSVLHSHAKSVLDSQNSFPSYSFTSSSAYANKKFLISKFLTTFFKLQSYIPSHVSQKYFDRLRRLLLDKYDALKSRIEQTSSRRNRHTKVFIKFSYKNDVTYLGFHFPCPHPSPSSSSSMDCGDSTICSLPVSRVLSRRSWRCPLHFSDLDQSVLVNSLSSRSVTNFLSSSGRKSNDSPVFSIIKPIYSNRLGVSYEKVFLPDSRRFSNKFFVSYSDPKFLDCRSSSQSKRWN